MLGDRSHHVVAGDICFAYGKKSLARQSRFTRPLHGSPVLLRAELHPLVPPLTNLRMTASSREIADPLSSWRVAATATKAWWRCQGVGNRRRQKPLGLLLSPRRCAPTFVIQCHCAIGPSTTRIPASVAYMYRGNRAENSILLVFPNCLPKGSLALRICCM